MSNTLRASSKRARAFSPNTGLKMATTTDWNLNMSKLELSDEMQAKRLHTVADKENIEFVKPFADLSGIVIEVEGNIGSGKSTLTRHIKEMVQKEVGEESCSVFFEHINNDFLGAFYSNIKRYSFAFQMYMLTTRLYQMDEGARQAEQERRMVMLDRGAVGDTVFALLNHQAGNMDDEEMKIYKSVCNQRMPKSISDCVDIVMYLDVDPRECHRRVTKERKNDAEDGIPLAYLESVDDCYFHLLMDWFANRKGTYHELNIGTVEHVVVLRWNKYGDARDATQALQDVLSSKRPSPSVNFQVEQPQNKNDKNTLSIHTEEDLNAAFDLLDSTDCPTPMNESRQMSLDINWGLTHTNAFKRLCMYFLSIQGEITYYGESTAVVAKKSD